MTALALEVKGLTKTFGGLRAVDRVSFEIPTGSLSTLIGPNGSGKTTLFNLITNLYRADAGEVRLFGAGMAGAGDWRIAASGVVRTFQTARVFPGMTAFENVLAGAHRHVRSVAWQQMLWLGRAREEERALGAQAEAL
ncbi:MAG TPA: ATP-binding cassette domain-containing protein, partial [Stellaceae bacterium]|nr:ATP-binding cassette domain-containing protein [Stellaceae bacterium]